MVGGIGMGGGYALGYALENPGVGSVTAIGGRKLGLSHPKLKEVLHGDFANCSALAETFSGQYAAVFCVGTYTGAVSGCGAPYHNGGLHDRVGAAAAENPCELGADPTGRSRLAFARYKDSFCGAISRAREQQT